MMMFILGILCGCAIGTVFTALANAASRRDAVSQKPANKSENGEQGALNAE
ncbi:MAG: hypothetical protein ACI4F7_03545 [Acutalibacteraceae bacterium]